MKGNKKKITEEMVKRNDTLKSSSKREFLKLLGAGGAGALLGLVSSGLAGASNPTAVTIEPGSFAETASYVIYTDGTYIYARNGLTGAIDFKGTDAATVIQSAINALTNGGIIFLKAGTYIITTKISILYGTNNGITLQGEGHGVSIQHGVTILKWKDNLNPTTVMLNIGGTNCYLRDIFIDGNKANNPSATGALVNFASEDGGIERVGILFGKSYGLNVSAHAAHFRNVFVEECDGVGVNVAGSWGCKFSHVYSAINGQFGFYIYGNTHNNSFIGCVAQDNTQDGFVVQSYQGLASLNNFIGCHVVNTIAGKGTYGFRLLGSQRNLFEGCILKNFAQSANNTYDGFYLASQGTTPSLYNLIKNCYIYSDTTNKHRYGVNEADANQNYNFVEGVYSEGEVTGKIRLQGPNSKARNNPMYVTENKGTATIAANTTSITVSHGLASTPSKVVVTPIGDPGTRYWVANVGATSFDIVIAVAQTVTVNFYWEAEV